MTDPAAKLNFDHHSRLPSDMALRAKALESVLVEKGLVDPATIDAVIDAFENKIGPHIGARVVAKAWTDPAFRQRLFDDATVVVADLGYTGEQTTHIVALENTRNVHNVVVCTLCSCYPWMLLGLPPTWYKSEPYRARIVREPRAVLREFGLDLGGDVEVRVWDSTSEIRYLVVPERPEGTDGMSEAELAALVGRNAMIGTARVAPPARNDGR